jgi:hypothetical protein
MNNEQIWESLIREGYVDADYNDDNKMFAIKIYQNDLQYLKKNHEFILGNTIRHQCFLIAAGFCNDVEIITFLIDVFEIDTSYINEYGNNCLMCSCYENDNLKITKYLIEEAKVDIKYINNEGNNYFLQACKNNDLSIIKYLVEDIKMDVNLSNKNGDNCITLACRMNKNLDVIKYLFENLHAQTNQLLTHNNIVPAYANNSNIEIINYLITYFQPENKRVKCHYLKKACMFNNIEVIKHLLNYLKHDVRNDVNYCFNDSCLQSFGNYCSDNECLIVACTKSYYKIEILAYMFENTNIKISLNNIDFFLFKKIIPCIKKNFYQLNKLLDLGLKKYEMKNMIPVIQNINPLMIEKNIGDLAGVKHPYLYKYNVFSRLVDKSQFNIPEINNNINDNTNDNTKKRKLACSDYSKYSQILFVNDNIRYYGDRDIVYNSIIPLREIKDNADFSEDVQLSVPVPKYIMNLYIEACHTHEFNLSNVEFADIIQFLKFIDQYPTNLLSIDRMECELLHYFDTHNVDYDKYKHSDFIKAICKRYDFKTLYVHIHNNKNK